MAKTIGLLVEQDYQDLEVWYPYYRLKEAGHRVLVIGSEGYGMRPLVRASCDELMRVPQSEHGVGSLNASCAATALLYEIARQNRKA
jgi:tRNA G18 (ribose-2'-O)-methylase SpoU